ncbi:hypothetical protein CPB85DRAFT_1429840 [Mucidula mucida]|nr:hypothetical protein CPB85DRAFT_1429840 [Mucidula mucida]
MSRLTAVLADAQCQLDSLEELRQAHIRLFPPIHMLPVEILLAIFKLTVKKPYQFSSIQDGPWGLGHVCRIWRQITAAPSSLWSSPYCGSYCNAMLSTVFERSLPLVFHYEINSKRASTDIVKHHSLRWHKITLIGATDSHLQLGDVGPLPLLAAVALRISGQMEPESFAQILHPFQSAPKLQSLKLTIDSRVECLTPLPSAFPWHQLTHLDHSIRWSTFLLDCQLLSHCPDLQSYITQSRDEPGSSDAVHHSKLTFLGIQHVALLRYLQCTSLTGLKLSIATLGKDAIRRYVLPLRTFLGHSPLLTYININAVLGSGRLFPFLSTFTFTNIRKLELKLDIEDDDMCDIQPLVASATPLLFPNLTQFACASSRPMYFCNTERFDQSLFAVIESRWHVEGRGVAQLQLVRLPFKSGYCMMAADERRRMTDSFRVLKEEGLDIAVFWGEGEARQQLL